MAAAESQNRPPRTQSGGAKGAAKNRALRIGIVLGGTLVEERLIREHQTVSVGQSIQNTFSVPISGLPLKWPLLVWSPGRCELRFTRHMDGRVSEGGDVSTLGELVDQGAAEQQGDHWVVSIGESARGKITAGKLTLLFQFVTPPPVQPRPRLPAAVRSGLTERIDNRLAAILGASLALHLGVAIWALGQDRVAQSRIERLQDEMEEEYEARAVDAEFELPEEPEEEPAEEEADIEAPDPDEIAEAPGPEDEPEAEPGDEEEAGGAAGDPDAIREQIEDTAFLGAAVGSEGEDGRYGDMRETDMGASLDDAIEDVREGGSEVAAGGAPPGERTRGPEEGEIGTGDGPGVEGPGDGGGGDGIEADPEEDEIPSRADFAEGGETLDQTDLDPQDVAQRIRNRYLQGIQRCHERVLRQDPDAGGRVELDFTVGAGGQVVRADVFGFNPVVDDCIEGLTANWRFGVPRDDAGNATQADFIIPLVLEPGG